MEILEFYLNKAKYIAIDEAGNSIDLEVDYWNSSYTVSKPNRQLEEYAAKLLNRKHRINFIHKMHEQDQK